MSKKRKCPQCGGTDIAHYVYGLPASGAKNTKRKLFGGCCIDSDSPQYHCNACGKDFSEVLILPDGIM